MVKEAGPEKMAIIQFVLALILLGVLYVRMIRREEPERISRAQAIVPVVLGAISVPLSFGLFLGMGGLLLKAGMSFDHLPAAANSVLRAFFAAGLPEEISKLLLMLLSILIFRSRIRNVYECVLIGAGIGMGFTLLEEFFYGSGGMTAIIRLVTVAAHMIFGMIMARHLGMAAYRKANKKSGVAVERLLAIVIPVIIHTIFDACTATNRMLDSSDDAQQMIGIVIALAAMAALFVLQIVIIRGFKRKTVEYCGFMTVDTTEENSK